MSFCAISVLLVLGIVVRSSFSIFQRLFIPSSVIGGFIGLIVIQTLGQFISPDWFVAFGQLPGFLINIVFAGLFLGAAATPLKKIWGLAAPQFCFGQINAWGQYVIGLGLVFVFLGPVFGVPDVFGNLLEIGFQGGHGTVGGMAHTFDKLGWPAGADLGYTVATCGIVFGIIIGMVLINIAVRKGYVSGIRTFDDKEKLERVGVYPRGKQPVAGLQTVQSNSLDSLALHISLVGIAVLIGYGIKELLVLGETFTPVSIQEMGIMESLPLFPLCMIGGVLLQIFLRKTRLDYIADHGQMQRICGASLDFLVVAAIASIRIGVRRRLLDAFVHSCGSRGDMEYLYGYVYRATHFQRGMVRALHCGIRSGNGCHGYRTDALAHGRPGSQDRCNGSIRIQTAVA